jgi:uncharacterized membrane protein HdeD (DUF308 family)
MSERISSPGIAGLFSRSWWILLLRGLFAVVLGILVFTRPALTLAVVVKAFGIYALVEGASSLFAAMRGWSYRDDRWLLLLEAAVGIVVGIITLRTPGITAMVLIFFIAIWALGTGVLRIVEAIRLRREISGEVWLVLGGLASVLFALLVLTQPLAGAIVMLRLIAAYALILGMTEVMLAFRLHSAKGLPRPGVSESSPRRAA